MTVKITYHQFLSALEAEETDRFIENTSQEILDEFFSSNETKNWLVNAFDWYISPEGFDYWRKINDRIFDDENHIVEPNKKVSSVEWLFRELMDTDNINPYDMELIKIIEQAKQMHKDEMIEAMNRAQIIDDVDFDGNVTFVFNNIEQYYNETF